MSYSACSAVSAVSAFDRGPGWRGYCWALPAVSRDRVALGKTGEDLACGELERRGYAIIARRHRCRGGELDVIARDGATLVFVEVKARNTYDAGAYAVTPMAQQRIARAAQTLAGRWRLNSAPIRFDLVVIGSGLLPRHERAAWYDEPRVG